MRVVACELPDEVLVATMYTSQILMGCVPARTMHSQSDIYQQRIYTELTNSVQRMAIPKDLFIPSTV
jgi:hypothetical protein